ncbi:MAG: Gfo/Idh/MocA family oxidoreductase [Chloroflexi bacterium]|nr:Gfo/Idh/MocA family oxidoreductase [Chloroflexota bacterium]
MPAHRIGILGCGARGRAFAAAVAACDAAELIICVDDDLADAQAVAGEFGGQAVANWADQALNTLIMTIPRVDAATLQAATQAGIHVLVDPPLARGVVEARRMARAAERRPARVGVAFEWRFQPLVRLLRAVVPRPRFAHLVTAVDAGPPQAPMSVRDTVWTTPHHALDLLMHLLGGAPAEIVADGGPLPRPTQGPATVVVPPRADALVAELYFDRERHAALTAAGGGADPELGSVVLDLTDGTTRIRVWSDWTAAEILALDGRSLDPPRLPGLRLAREGRAWMARAEHDGQALADLVLAFADGAPGGESVPGAADGARAVALTRAVLAGAASGRTQTLRAA